MRPQVERLRRRRLPAEVAGQEVTGQRLLLLALDALLAGTHLDGLQRVTTQTTGRTRSPTTSATW
jgi:hypothetical protein